MGHAQKFFRRRRRGTRPLGGVGAHPLLTPDYQAYTRLPGLHPTTKHASNRYLAWTRLPCMDLTTLHGPEHVNGHENALIMITTFWAQGPMGPMGPKWPII